LGKDWVWGWGDWKTGLSEAELVVSLEQLDELETVEIVPELSERWCKGILGERRPVGVGPSRLQAGGCKGYLDESLSVVHGRSCD
jgi:hypothetical protein